MILLTLFTPPAIWYLAKESFPRVSKLFGFISLALAIILSLNAINSM